MHSTTTSRPLRLGQDDTTTTTSRHAGCLRGDAYTPPSELPVWPEGRLRFRPLSGAALTPQPEQPVRRTAVKVAEHDDIAAIFGDVVRCESASGCDREAEWHLSHGPRCHGGWLACPYHKAVFDASELAKAFEPCRGYTELRRLEWRPV